MKTLTIREPWATLIVSGYAFILKNIIKYDKPIYCKGKLGFWNYEG